MNESVSNLTAGISFRGECGEDGEKAEVLGRMWLMPNMRKMQKTREMRTEENSVGKGVNHDA